MWPNIDGFGWILVFTEYQHQFLSNLNEIEPLDSYKKCESSGYKYVKNELHINGLTKAGLIYSIYSI